MPNNATISARPSGPMSWLEDLQADVKHGTDVTLPGKILHLLGAPGTERGVPEAVSNFMPGGGPTIVV